MEGLYSIIDKETEFTYSTHARKKAKYDHDEKAKTRNEEQRTRKLNRGNEH